MLACLIKTPLVTYFGKISLLATLVHVESAVKVVSHYSVGHVLLPSFAGQVG